MGEEDCVTADMVQGMTDDPTAGGSVQVVARERLRCRYTILCIGKMAAAAMFAVIAAIWMLPVTDPPRVFCL